MSEAATLIKTIWVPSLVSIGSILNLLTIMVFCRRRMRKYCISMSMMCLAIADTAVLLIPVLLTWIDEHFFHSYYVNNTVWCNLHGYVDLVSCANSSWIILLISIERWFAVCRPWHKNQIFTSRMVARTLLFIFLASTLLFAYFPFSLRLDSEKAECQIEHQQVYRIMGTVSVILVYVMPFFMLAILNVMIIIRLRQRPFQSTSISASHAARSMSINPRSLRSPSHPATAAAAAGGGHLMPTSSTFDDLPSSPAGLRRPSELPSTTTPPLLLNHPSTTTTGTSFAATNNTSKNDRNLSITLVTLAITFMIFTFPFQAHWFYENIYKMFVTTESSEASTSSTSTSSSSAITSLFDVNQTEISKTKHEAEVGDEEESESINMIIREVTFMIKNMNYLINFFLYSLLSKLFRQELLAMIGGGNCDETTKPSRLACCLRKLQCTAKSSRGRGEDASSSSFAELSFSVEAFKSLKRGQYRNNNGGRRKLFFFKVEPANFFEYFRQVGAGGESSSKKNPNISSRDAKLLKLEKELLNSRAETRHPTSYADEENNNNNDIQSVGGGKKQDEEVKPSKSIQSVHEIAASEEKMSAIEKPTISNIYIKKSKTCDAILVNNKRSKSLIKFTRISTKTDPHRHVGHV